MNKKIRNYVMLSLLSVILIPLSVLPYSHISIFIAFAPLIILTKKAGLKNVLLFSSISGFLISVLIFFWVVKHKLLVFSIVISLFTIFIILFCLLNHILYKKIKNWSVIFIPPFAWVLFMKIFSYTPFDSFLINPAIAFPLSAPLIWFVGNIGITFLILLFNSLLAHYYLNRKRAYIALIFLLTCTFTACFIYSSTATIQGNSINVALIQGDFPYAWRWRYNNSLGNISDTYIALSHQAADKGADIIIWPEYAIVRDIEKLPELKIKLQNFTNSTKRYLLFGSIKELSPDKRKNRAILLGPDGKISGQYDSLYPFPFDKRVVSGDELIIFNSALGKFGVNLCYEEVKPQVSRTYAKNGAQFLVSISNNQAMAFYRGMHITSLYSKLRAVENARYNIRVTNNGITQIINPFGRIVKAYPQYSRGFITGTIILNNKKTFYTEHNDLLVNLTLLSFFTYWLINYFFRRKSNRK